MALNDPAINRTRQKREILQWVRPDGTQPDLPPPGPLWEGNQLTLKPSILAAAVVLCQLLVERPANRLRAKNLARPLFHPC